MTNLNEYVSFSPGNVDLINDKGLIFHTLTSAKEFAEFVVLLGNSGKKAFGEEAEKAFEIYFVDSDGIIKLK